METARLLLIYDLYNQAYAQTTRAANEHDASPKAIMMITTDFDGAAIVSTRYDRARMVLRFEIKSRNATESFNGFHLRFSRA